MVPTIKLPFSAKVLEVVLDYLYTDDGSALEGWNLDK